MKNKNWSVKGRIFWPSPLFNFAQFQHVQAFCMLSHYLWSHKCISPFGLENAVFLKLSTSDIHNASLACFRQIPKFWVWYVLWWFEWYWPWKTHTFELLMPSSWNSIWRIRSYVFFLKDLCHCGFVLRLQKSVLDVVTDCFCLQIKI